MKNLKFRAWDKEEKTMFNIARIDIADGSCYSHLFASDIYDYWNDVEIMQYTGYNDITGKEIHESDIVETTRILNHIVGRVVMIKGCWYIQDEKDSFYRLIPKFGKVENKVIGNIYENN